MNSISNTFYFNNTVNMLSKRTKVYYSSGENEHLFRLKNDTRSCELYFKLFTDGDYEIS